MPGTSSEPGTAANRCKYPSPHVRTLLGPPRAGRGPHVLRTRLSAWESAGRWSRGGGERLGNHMRVHAVVFAACQHALLRSARPCCCGVPVITLTRLPATAVPAVSSPPADSEIPACARVLLIIPLPGDFPAEAGGAGDCCSNLPALPPGPWAPAGSASVLQHRIRE